MNILIFYGATEGQTRKIARPMVDRVIDLGRTPTLVNAVEVLNSIQSHSAPLILVFSEYLTTRPSGRRLCLRLPTTTGLI